MNTQLIESTFYKNISKLFYAFMAIDKHVRKEEYRACIQQLKETWPEKEGVVSIEQQLKKLIVNKENAMHCFLDFESYYKSHHFLFSTIFKKSIKNTAGIIASAFGSKNKSELILLAKLQLLMK